MHDVVIIGGGASGLLCAIEAGRRGMDVLVLERGPKVGLKILVSGGGRCNFTNRWADPRKQYLSRNEHFCISAMRRYEPSHFIDLVDAHKIPYHEKKLGQLFCDTSAKDIVAMLLDHCSDAGVTIRVNQEVTKISRTDEGFSAATDKATHHGRKAVIASGGLSLPKIATDLAFRTANDFEIDVIETRPALVPLTWNSGDKPKYENLSGISVDAVATCNDVSFRENILFTHRGLSGPAILQVSSYWREGDPVYINLLPELDAATWLVEEREKNTQGRLTATLKSQLPNRVIDTIAGDWFEDTKLGTFSPKALAAVGEQLNRWEFTAGGSEGYRTAEVTLGGINTDEVSSKTFELNKVPGLYAVGEALDVTGWLGGYNFQWAWASAWCCAQHL